MREIKFRYICRHKPSGNIEVKHYTLNQIEERPLKELSPAFWDDYETVARVQFAGLHDNNSTEIYEGDIVKVTSLEYGGETIGKVAWGMSDFNHGNYPAFCIPEFESELNSFSQILDTGDYEIEIIGNIHEQPHLLERD